MLSIITYISFLINMFLLSKIKRQQSTKNGIHICILYTSNINVWITKIKKKGAYFQLWTKCRGWSQSKPAENAVRKTHTHKYNNQFPQHHDNTRAWHCFNYQQFPGGSVSEWHRHTGRPVLFCSVKLALMHEAAVDNNSTVPARVS